MSKISLETFEKMLDYSPLYLKRPELLGSIGKSNEEQNSNNLFFQYRLEDCFYLFEDNITIEDIEKMFKTNSKNYSLRLL